MLRFFLTSLLLLPFASAQETSTDVVVYGATPGGIAAAISAAKSGSRVTLINPIEQIGGLTTSGLSHADFHSLESLSGSYADFASRVEDYYRLTYGADSEQLRTSFHGNFGEPKINLMVLEKMLAEQPKISVVRHAPIRSVAWHDRRLDSIEVAGDNGTTLKFSAKIFIDGSYEGDLMAKAGVEFHVGREGSDVYHEALAPEAADEQVQAYNFRLTMTDDPANRVPTEKPQGYARENFTALLPVLASGKINKIFGYPSGCIFKAHQPPLPNRKYDINDVSGGLVRLSLAGKNYAWPAADEAKRSELFAMHYQDQIGLLYFLQNDPEVPEKFRNEAREWGFCRDEFEATDHLPPELYVREARRMAGVHTFTQGDSEHAPGDARAKFFPDAIAMGDYGNNCHGTAHEGPRFGGKHTGEFYNPVPPYQIPYGVILPKSLDNLLVPVAASSSHVGFCALRYEPIWMSLGQAAGYAATLAVKRDLTVQAVPIEKLQELLRADHSATAYFSDVRLDSPDFAAVQWWALKGGFHRLEPMPATPGERGKNIMGQYFEANPGHAAKLDQALDPALSERWTQIAAGLKIKIKPAATRGDFIRSAYASFIASPLHASEIQLSPSGPISTPLAARDAARKAEKPVTIIVADGTYPIAETVALGPEDSQTTWQAAPAARPIFSGGRRITGWKKLPDGLWKAELPEVREGRWYFQQLWINGRRATRARTPNKGFMRMEDRANSMIFPAPKPDDAKWEASLLYQSFIASPETIAELNRATPEEIADLTLIIPHTWDVHHYHVKEINSAANAVLMQGPGTRELLLNEPDGRFYAENYRAALDEPGEWFLSRSGELLYLPLPGEDMSKAEVIAPVSERWFSIDGAKDIDFKGLSFQHQQWNMGPKGFGDSQAAQSMGAAIEIDRSENIHFQQCEIAHTGGYALWFRLDTSDSGIADSHIHDLGAGGVRIGPTSLSGGEKITGFITVDDNIIQHGGRIFPDAIGVFVGHASDNIVRHNDIGDFYYSGISSGWHWGYGETRTHRNLFENNHIHHIGWGFTSDMGGFYNLGSSFGTIVRGNHIHDIASYRYGGWGLYTDEGSSGITMENNLVHDTSESGFHQHYGFYNTVRNNIFAFGKKAQIQRSRSEKHLSFVYEKNIVVWDPASKFLDGTSGNWAFPEKPESGYPKANTIMRNNLYWPLDGRMPLIAQTWTWDEWRKLGHDAGSIIADPLFENLDQRDFRLKSASPAANIGFKPWDLTLAGVRKDGPRGPAWRALAEEAKFPNWAEDSKPWPAKIFSIRLNTFENTALKTLPILGATASAENKGDSIGVSDEASSPIPLEGAKETTSKRSLKFQDAPDLSKSYNPILSIDPKWDSGNFHLSFDVTGQPAADWFVEMRSSGGGEFAAGPYISWKKGKLTAGASGSIPLGDLAPGEWARISISATPGTAKWQATITRQDGTKHDFSDLPCKPSWNQCHYVLWSSLANQKTAFFIDNLQLLRD